MENKAQVTEVKDALFHLDYTGNKCIDMEVKIGEKVLELKDLKTMKSDFLGRVYKFFGAAIETPSGKFVKKDIFFENLSNVCAREILKEKHEKFNENDVKWLASSIEIELNEEKKFSTRGGKLSTEKVQPLWNRIMTIDDDMPNKKKKI